MIPESLALFNAFLYLGLICLAGALCGTLARVVLRLSWSPWVVLQDLAIAAVVSFLTMIATVFYYYHFRASVDGSPRTFIVAGVAAPVFRHILRFAWLHWRGGVT